MRNTFKLQDNEIPSDLQHPEGAESSLLLGSAERGSESHRLLHKPQFFSKRVAVFVFLWYNEAKKYKGESYGKGSI